MYANLGLEALQHALKTAEVGYIVANPSLLPQLVSSKEKLGLKCIILTKPLEVENDLPAQELRDFGIKLITFDEVISLVRIHYDLTLDETHTWTGL